MTRTRPMPADDPDTIPRMPPWVTLGRGESAEDVAFLSGAALGHLHLVVGCTCVPQMLWRDRLALRAAEACLALAGRSERAGELRDEVHLLRPGDRPGPAGQVCLNWQRAVERPVSVRGLRGALPRADPERIATWLDAGQGGAVARAASVLETVLAETRRDEAMALILAEAALSRALGWAHVVPLLAAGLRRSDLRETGCALRLACRRAVVRSAAEAVRLAADLAQRAAQVHRVAPKLRARRAEEAVALFLARDAVAPAALTAFMSDRAARRLCERLVSLGVVRELTGRETFRLYGV